MRGYLRRKKIEGGSTTLDVTVDYSGGTDMSVDSMVEVTITGANGLLHGMAYVGLQYPWFEAGENVEALGAKIVGPETGISGLLPVGTILSLRLMRDC